MRMQTRTRRALAAGFTLVELLVVIGIIAILVSLLAAGVMKIWGKGPFIQTSSEIRQLEVKVIVSNLGDHMVNLEFPTDQRIEVQLLDSGGNVLTKWSENHLVKETPATILVNPGEHIEYKESIATRDLTPGRVFTAEVFFPKYPELRIRQKFLTEP